MVSAPPGQGQPLRLHNLRSSLFSWKVEAAAALFAIVLYLPAVSFPLLFDDHALIDASGRPLALGGGFPYRPVRYASYWIDSALGGSATVYHAHNVLLFAVLIALVVVLARRLGATPKAALLGSLMVAAHPLAVEAVAYVAGRRDLLSAVFGLGAMLAWIDAKRPLALLLLLCGAGSKENALLLAPGMMLASASGVATRRSGDLRLLMFGALAAIALAIAYGAVGPWMPAPDLAGIALPGRVLVHYVDHLLRPMLLAGAHLSAEYPDLGLFVERVRGGESAAMPLAALSLVLTVTLVAATMTAIVRAVRSGPDAGIAACASSFVAAWAAIAAAAVAIWGGLHEPGADRHALVVLPVLGIAVALVLTRLRGKLRPPLLVLSGMTVLALAAATVRQTQTWSSERTLWSNALAMQPDAPRARLNLAGLLAQEGRYDEAAWHLGELLHRQPEFADAWLGRAVVRCAQRKPGAARRNLSRAQALGAASSAVEGIGRDCPLPEFANPLTAADKDAPSQLSPAVVAADVAAVRAAAATPAIAMPPADAATGPVAPSPVKGSGERAKI